MVSGLKVFYQNALRQTLTTGSIAPSSPFLANAITSCVEKKGAPLRILEAGPGTGPFTKKLAGKINAQDHLDLCELNPTFVEYLAEICETYPDLCAKKDCIRIHHKALQEMEGEHCYDYIVSGLPLNNFPPALVQEILGTFQRLIKPGGLLSFFEYYMIRHMRRPFVGAKEKDCIVQREKILNAFLSRFEEKRILVPLNFPPAIVYVCRIGE